MAPVCATTAPFGKDLYTVYYTALLTSRFAIQFCFTDVLTLVLRADANFPAASVAACTVDGMIRADGIDIPTLLAAILKLFPLDPAVPHPCGMC